MRLLPLLRTAAVRLLSVILFFSSLIPILIENGKVPVHPSIGPWVPYANVFFAVLLAALEWRRFREAGYRLGHLKEEFVDWGILAIVVVLALEEVLTGGGVFGLEGWHALIVPSKVYILANTVLRIVRLFRFIGRARWSYPKVFAGSFLLVILGGAVLLWAFPGALRNPDRPVAFVDALFTSVSAVCVTGLTVVDTGATFDRFGQIVILILIQIGGLGLMTFAAFFAMALGKGIGFTDRLMLRDMLNVDPLNTLGRVLAGTVAVTFVVEGLGALAMFGRFPDPADPSVLLPPGEQAYYAVFHSVSAFCNAGFSLYPDNWMRFVGNPVMSGSLMALIVLGGLGFTVILNVLGMTKGFAHWIRRRLRRRPLTEEEEMEEERREPVRISLQTKVVLGATAGLVFGGAFLVWLFEKDGALQDMDGKTTFLACLFQSITPRTAGFNSLDTALLQPVTLYFVIFLMFVGASPGGTGGGIKTVTAAVLVRSVTALARGRARVEMGRKSLPAEVASQAVVVVVMSFLAVFFGSLLLTLSEGPLLRGEVTVTAGGMQERLSQPFLALLFEAVSAFGTVGLSAGFTGGLTAFLSDMGKVVLMVLMFLGRIGPLALVLAMGRKRSQSYQYPDERVMIG